MELITAFIGSDISKDFLDAHLLPRQHSFRLPNSSRGRAQLIEQLPEQGTCLIVMKASRGYERTLACELVAAGHAVSVTNPRQVRDFAKALGIRDKTDRLDARVIARFALQVQPRPLAKSPEKQDQLDERVSRRRQLVEQRTAEMNRKGTALTKAVKESLQLSIDLINKQLKRIDRAILELVESHDDWQQCDEIIKSVPGVGDVTAATLLAQLPEPGHLNRQEIAALVGVAPMNRDSGNHRGMRSIQGGRASVRSTLCMTALTACRCNPVIRNFAHRLKSQGKKPKVLLTASLRKLLVILNTMVATNTHWAPRLAIAE